MESVLESHGLCESLELSKTSESDLKRPSSESISKSNSTQKSWGTGIGPCYASKANRNGLRFCDLMEDDASLVAKLTAIRAFQVSTPITAHIR